MRANIKRLQNLYSWNQFYQARQLKNEMRKCQSEIHKLKKEINNLELERKAFDKNDKLLEQYARENYMMKKKSEDIYYVSENQ